MPAKIDALEQGLDPSPTRWLETAVLTLLPPAVGLLLRPEDPLFLTSDFPWLALAPLMVGLRYGFAHGFSSALVLALVAGVRHRWMAPELGLPGARIVGTLVVGMLAGEFCDRWMRRIQRLRVVGRYRQQRLEEFSRAYHLLKVSHDRLEERMAGNTTSLRGALLTLRARVVGSGAKDLSEVGDAVMDLFAEHGWVQVAGLHAIDVAGELVASPTACLGAPVRVDPRLEMIRRAIVTRALVTVRELPESQGPLAVVPLEAVGGELIGVAVVHEMPFVAFTQEHLHLLVVLGGHTADLLVSARQSSMEADPAEMDFVRHLSRAHEDLRRYGIVSSLAAIVLSPRALKMGVDRIIEGTRRGLDQDRKLPGPDEGMSTIFLLMPLTDLQGIEGYENRIHGLVRERLGTALGPEDVRIHGAQLSSDVPPVEQLGQMRRRCGYTER